MAKQRIMIAEDNQDIRQLTKCRLEHEGYAVLTAVDGEDVLQQVQAGPPVDLILLDVLMPKLDGYQVCRQLKGQRATKAIPIIVVTASEWPMTRLGDRCIEAGADGWIKKPFQARELLGKIRDLLGQEEHSDG